MPGVVLYYIVLYYITWISFYPHKHFMNITVSNSRYLHNGREQNRTEFHIRFLSISSPGCHEEWSSFLTAQICLSWGIRTKIPHDTVTGSGWHPCRGWSIFCCSSTQENRFPPNSHKGWKLPQIQSPLETRTLAGMLSSWLRSPHPV